MQIYNKNFDQIKINKRFDAEFYSPKYDKVLKEISINNTEDLKSISHVTDGNHLSIASEFDEKQEGIKYLRGQDVNNLMLLNNHHLVTIPESIYSTLERSHIFNNDILISIVGTIGNVALVLNQKEKIVANCKLAIVRTHNKKIDPYYLYAFLISKFGQTQIKKSIRGSVQTGIVLPDLRTLKVIRLPKKKEQEISNLIKEGHSKIEDSKKIYEKAQKVVLKRISFDEINLKKKLSFSTNLKEINSNKRIDAEFFQPKYENFMSHLAKFKCDKLSQLVNFEKGVEVGSDKYTEDGIPFTRVSNITPMDLTEEKFISLETYKALKQNEPKLNDIFLSKDGTPGISYHFKKNPKNLVYSGGILKLSQIKKIVSMDVLSIILNSKIVKIQMERDAGGSIIKHWRPEQIENVMIPIFSTEIQREISSLIKESDKLKNNGLKIIDVAKNIIDDF